MSVYDEGYEAYTRGLDINDNPYNEGSVEYLKWEDGWFDSEEDDW